MPARCRLLAGSVGPERVPARPDPEDADWYLPLHVRDARSARERIAALIAAGADVVVAPTWLTHRRALLPLGETRRAAEWSAAAVRLAREGVEIGLERRAEINAEAAADGQADPVLQRPQPMVAASLPALDDDPEIETGRLLPQEAATQRDYRDQAGYLADAAADLLAVEGQRSTGSARAAIAEAAGTGLPVWAALSQGSIAETGLEAWLAWARATGVERILVPPPLASHRVLLDAGTGWGGLPAAAGEVPDWLGSGADVLARVDRADEDAVSKLRAAIDDVEREALRLERAATDRWHDHVRDAASVAPGGAAAWVGSAPERALPAGFAWAVVPPEGAAQLPSDHFRLLVVADASTPGVEAALERGGVLASRAPIRGAARDLRVIRVSDEREPPLLLYRREG